MFPEAHTGGQTSTEPDIFCLMFLFSTYDNPIKFSISVFL